MLPVSLDCPLLIASSVFSNVYLSVSINKGQSRETGNIGYTRQINVREYRRGNQKGTIQKNRQTDQQ
jgi:hypothetical protein